MHPVKYFLLGYAPRPILRFFMKKYEGRLKQIIVLRTDLKMRRGKEIAQGSHASMGGLLANRRNPFMRMWLEGAFAKIAVGIEDEESLLAMRDRSRELGIPHCLIQDQGRTEFAGIPTYTAISVGPGDPDLIQSLTGHLKLR